MIGTDILKPLKEFQLSAKSLGNLENIVLDSLKVSTNKYFGDSANKRLVLRFLSNAPFIKDFTSEKLNKEVIFALKNR